MTAAERRILIIDRDWATRCAQQLLDAAASAADPIPALSRITVVLPNLLLAAELSRALAKEVGSGLLLPRFYTLSGLADAWRGDLNYQPNSQRIAALYSQLAHRNWVPNAARWALSRSLVSLFDDLVANLVSLPANEAEFIAQVERAHELVGNQNLQFEARVAHTLWCAEAAGTPGLEAVRAMALSRAASAARDPLFVLCEQQPQPAQRALAEQWSCNASVCVWIPTWSAEQDVVQCAQAAWPAISAAEPQVDLPALLPLADRAAQLAMTQPNPTLLNEHRQVRIVSVEGLEGEAEQVVQSTLNALAKGAERIAWVALDRLTARRARALLERHQVLVQDETGWKLSTSRAAALIDAALEVLLTDAYHRDVIDLLKSPFMPAVPAQDLIALEQLIARHNHLSGLQTLSALCQVHAPTLATLLQPLQTATDVFLTTRTSLGEWLRRLQRMLQALGVQAALVNDVAGHCLLELLQTREREMQGSDLLLDATGMRAWLEDELDQATFRDAGIESPVVLTSLAATRLRAFDAVVVMGCDAHQLAPVQREGLFASPGLRAQLGLPAVEQDVQGLRDDVLWLLLSCDDVTWTWQKLKGDEVIALAPELLLLNSVCQQAYGTSLIREAARWPAPDAAAIPAASILTDMPHWQTALPSRVSVGQLGKLLHCPYQFYAAALLNLAPEDEVAETVEKADYGTLLHAALATFHKTFANLAEHDDATLAAALKQFVEREFESALKRDLQAYGWMAKFIRRIDSYLHWSREREQAGWRVALSEQTVEWPVEITDSERVVVRGRIDRADRKRVDASSAGEDDGLLPTSPMEQWSVLDYKTSSLATLQDKVDAPLDDLQLAAYVWMLEDLKGVEVAEAAFVALEAETVESVNLEQAQDIAEIQRIRVVTALREIRQGHALPALPSESACRYCEMAGLCRVAYQEISSEASPPSLKTGQATT